MKIRVFIIGIGLMLLTNFAQAQTNTFYFMEGVPTRSDMNPAFMPQCNSYFSLILFPNFYVGLGNNSFTLKDAIFNKNNRTITAISANQNPDNLYNRIRPITSIDVAENLKLLNFGVAIKEKGYFTFDFSLKSDIAFYMPRDLFKLALYGTPDEFGVNSFNFKSIGTNSSVYSELGLGYMHQINKKWTLGGRIKFLMGYASVYSINKELTLDASQKEWSGHADADIYASLPMEFEYTKDGNIDIRSGQLQQKYKDNYLELLNPSGYGAGIDFGATYKPIEALTISAALTDISFITWNKNLYHGEIHGEAIFNGINYKYGSDTIDFKQMGQDFVDAFHVSATDSKNRYTQMLTANFNLGVEYGFIENKISLGALSHTRFNRGHVLEEVTLAANFRPADWFKAYLSYSIANSRWNNIGLGMNLKLGPINTFIVADYIPMNWARVTSDGKTHSPIPYNSPRVNLQAGITFNIGCWKNDLDRDGVKNKSDMCPDTDIERLQKLCPDMKRKEFVSVDGCELDADSDGVHDCYDQCPNTPEGIQVDNFGCPIDSDGDGIKDDKDKCPDTPKGVVVDEKGCPVDSDGDGVADYLDKCPNTEKGITVDKNGCPVDSDKDGVADDKDKCPDTPKGVVVDEKGCPIDSDGDGVADYLDKCPNTPQEAIGKVDENGCPKDRDGDGIYDYMDRCPEVPGVANNNGCPELKEEVKRLFKQALQGIQFQSGKSTIKPISYPILNNIVKVMEENPDFKLNIAGHTDSQGKDDFNQKLSEDRAAAVKQYLINKGVAEERITSEGFGESKPVDTNDTAAGRKNNRRVEFTVVFLR